jgi:DNA helicase-2/ATP-dependent DNA helicase PcrA
LNQGTAPEKILALAFNKKARDEMQDRLDRRGVDGVEVRTFHSFGYEIVREGLGWTFTGSTYKKTAKALMKSAILEHTELPALRNKDPLDAFLAGLRRAKMELPQLSTVTIEYGDRIYPLEPIFYSYIQEQIHANFLDFDDMIYLAIRLLLENGPLRQDYQSRFEYVLVDEFQDLNEAQLLLLQIIGLPENNIFAVGDDDQMIYGFRGADVKHIVEFDKRFPIASNHVLNINYRSSQMIVRHAGWLIAHNLDRVQKDIQPRRGAQAGSFEVSGHASLLEQAEYAARWLVAHKKEHSLNWRDYAVLYRYNAYQFPIAVMLDAMGVPHSRVSGQHLFQSMVGIDVYSYLQILLSPKEARAIHFERILKRPNKYFTNQVIAQARDWRSFQRLPELSGLRDWERDKLLDFIMRVERLSQKAISQEMSAVEALHMLKTEFGIAEFYRDQSRKLDDLDQASDEDLLDVILALAENFKTLLEFFQFICKSVADQDSDAEHGTENETSDTSDARGNEVYLSTIHRAKGKEFQNVIYFNLSKTDADSKKAQFVEEERRVAYVAATRPKDDLLVTFSSAKPSEFLAEIALHPKFKGVERESLQRSLTSSKLRLEKAQVVRKQLEAKKEMVIAVFHELTNTSSSRWPAWAQGVIWKIENWRMDKTRRRIESLDGKIKKHVETCITPLLKEVQGLEEEEMMRASLGMK